MPSYHTLIAACLNECSSKARDELSIGNLTYISLSQAFLIHDIECLISPRIHAGNLLPLIPYFLF